MKNKEIIAWIILLILLMMIAGLVYIRFFGFYDYNDEPKVTDIEVSTDEAIDKALTVIVNNFNSDEDLKKIETEGIKLQATLKNHSLYIYHTELNNTITTYEFNYNHLTLNINIQNNEENLKKFNTIYKILLKSIQKRIDIEFNKIELIDSHINDNIELTGIIKTLNDSEKTINYKIDITKKINKKEGCE